MLENSLKVFDWETYREKLNVYKECYKVLKKLHSSRSYGKMRFIQERQKQSFTDKLINKFVKTCQKNAGYDYFVVAYGDGNFGLTIKGIPR